MNKTTGKPVTVNDEPVTAEAAFTPEGRDGEVKVAFIFNSYVITETTDVVVFESLYREDVEIGVLHQPYPRHRVHHPWHSHE